MKSERQAPRKAQISLCDDRKGYLSPSLHIKPQISTNIQKQTRKKAILLFWKGLTGIIAATANWLTTILGMKDESKYGKFIRRVVGGCFAFTMFIFVCHLTLDTVHRIFLSTKFHKDYHCSDSDSDSQYLSRSATCCSTPYENETNHQSTKQMHVK